MNAVWEASLAFIRREARLLVPLALGTILLGNVLNNVVAVAFSDTVLGTLVGLLAIGWALVGQIAVVALALRPGLSVGEAIALGARRLPILIGIGLLVAIPLVVIFAPLLVDASRRGVDMHAEGIQKFFSTMPTWAAFYLALVTGFLVWASARLSTLNAIVVERRQPGIWAAIRAAFAMTEGYDARLVLLMLIYIVVAFILSATAQTVFGSLFMVFGEALGSPFLVLVLTSFAVGLMATLMSVIADVFCALLYKRLSSGS